MPDLKTKYGKRFRVAYEESAEIVGQTEDERAWLQIIPGSRGHLFIQSQNTLGAYCGRRRLVPRLLAMPGVRQLCRGDTEASVAFDPSDTALFDQIAGLLKLKRRKRLSEEQVEVLRQRMAKINAPMAGDYGK